MITNITDKERELQAKLKQYEAVMRQALEVLKEYVNADAAPDELNPRKRQACAAITALREALEQPTVKQSLTTQPAQQEPPPFWPVVEHLLEEYGLQLVDFVGEYHKATQAAQQEPVAYGMWDTQLGRNRMMMVRFGKGQDGCTVPLYAKEQAHGIGEKE